jgi:hypothetical protein
LTPLGIFTVQPISVVRPQAPIKGGLSCAVRANNPYDGIPWDTEGEIIMGNGSIKGFIDVYDIQN